tara:strand:+ start:173 stop:340 length:168 start_codon:yes stop_codon:yes gene_type:complete
MRYSVGYPDSVLETKNKTNLIARISRLIYPAQGVLIAVVCGSDRYSVMNCVISHD